MNFPKIKIWEGIAVLIVLATQPQKNVANL